jgi:hypothetical protein
MRDTRGRESSLRSLSPALPNRHRRHRVDPRALATRRVSAAQASRGDCEALTATLRGRGKASSFRPAVYVAFHEGDQLSHPLQHLLEIVVRRV